MLQHKNNTWWNYKDKCTQSTYL